MSVNDTTRDFHHPYEPYGIQKQFMSAVYDCLEDGKVGIFESPTGTGKSLSLICGSLTWLREHKRRTFEDGFQIESAHNDDPPWMLEHARNQRKQEAFRRREELNERLAKVKAKEERAKERAAVTNHTQKRRKVGSDDANNGDLETQFALDDYESDQDTAGNARHSGFGNSGLSAETQALMDTLGYASSATKAEDGEMPDEIKIFFCSRTHSQLTQFSSELSRVKLPPAITMDQGPNGNSTDETMEDVKHLTLGSRKNLCINPKVSRLGNATAINERCLELQQATSNDSRCFAMPTKDSEVSLIEFRDNALAKIRDIEDLGTLGKQLGVCPYYASRPVIKFCEIVTLPYPLLLQRSAREALGLSLKDHIVIIDEAHNLMDAIAGIYSASVTLSQVQQARVQLTVYLQRFRNRLKGKNRVYVAQIIRILDSIIVYLQSLSTTSKASDGLADMGSIMSGKGVDQINIFKLNLYLQESKLARKVDGYTAYTEENGQEPSSSNRKDEPTKTPRHTVPVLMHVQTFLLSLMNPSAEGRFFYSKEDGGELSLRYLLLDPTYHFQDIVEDARAVVLAGGTMSPMSDYEHHLLPYLPSEKIQTLSCGHVIPPFNLLAAPITKAFNGLEFDFTFESRNKDSTIINLGNTILRIAGHVPDGLVVFFPSYAYLDTCIALWKRPSTQHQKSTFWEQLTQKKPIFLEQRSDQQSGSKSNESKEAAVDSVLTSYSAAVASGNGRGALLFAVIGGTLSEGINFSDALGRGVIVVGLPFPNPHSAEWKAKLQYITSKENARGGNGKAAARDFYENACMRAVNQCVGRAIRHKGDYAAIMMLDKRYSGERIQSKLPKWIRGSLTPVLGVQDMEKALDKFFAVKR
ncbi:helicase C-terminal domain-containing protein [Boeremia exigua]|uniref:helicase C-terminal domain-containing protein n=1 Tax=Boeremia exigua TaxID=749465 RepID=UPI001E8E3AA7|nr:helicase C-terminal domain-containing protein [Boeremia exigua]KAH6643831.1 helicase C-terminal domain-containing protein [Boeremia exigua]